MAWVCPEGRVVSGVATECWLFLTNAWVRILSGACENVASDLELGGGFRRALPIPPPVITGLSHELTALWQKE